MSVDSYLELFTTLFGWTFYGILWDVLLGTGIVFLPFLGILIDNWREPAEGGEFGTVTGLSLRRMELEMFWPFCDISRSIQGGCRLHCSRT